MKDEIEMVWLDIETTGLDTQNDVILEVGLVLTDRWGDVLNKWGSLVAGPGASDAIEAMKPIPYNMHVKSELLRDWRYALREGATIEPWRVEEKATAWLEEKGLSPETMPACGSSVHFDRAMLLKDLPALNDWFHYRNLDVSTLKNVCSLVNPTLFAKRPPESKDYKHRVFNCLEGSITEYQWYLDNFLFVGDEVL